MTILEGIVLSNKNKGTLLVEVTRRTPNKRYGKLVKKKKRYKVDLGESEAGIGDKVKIVETRPISKDKRFKIHSIIKQKGK